jgi:hypothetical protein
MSSARPAVAPYPMKPMPEDHDSPGVPGFRSWRGVYLFVFGGFLLTVLLLTWFAHVFA